MRTHIIDPQLTWNEAKEAFEPLVALLRDKDDVVRERAATALAQLGDNRAIEPLIMLASTGKDKTREAALEALKRLGYELQPVLEPEA